MIMQMTQAPVRDCSTNMLSLNHCKVAGVTYEGCSYEGCSFIHAEKWLPSVSVCWGLDCFFEPLPMMPFQGAQHPLRCSSKPRNRHGTRNNSASISAAERKNADSALVSSLTRPDVTGDPEAAFDPVLTFSRLIGPLQFQRYRTTKSSQSPAHAVISV